MALYILSNDACLESATRLGERLHTRVVTSACEVPMAHNPTVIRWGTSDLCHLPRDFETVLNPAVRIRENCNKLSAIMRLGSAVSVPTVYRRRIPAGVRAVVRPLEHTRGEGFSVVTGPCEVPEGSYAKEFIPNTTEYRVWFVGDHMMAGKRVPMEAQGQSPSDPCRSLWGYSWRDVTQNQRALVVAAKAVARLNFGAADILWSGEDDCYYVLELNTAPALDHDRVLEFFARTIPAELEGAQE